MTRSPEAALAACHGAYRAGPGGAFEFDFLTDATAYALALYGIQRADVQAEDVSTGNRKGALARELKQRGILTTLPDLWFRVRPLDTW
ncbi:hypothetical protein [Deinococcus pimensis]|uniref:hypothetical protein n=1 Tax=Deinococcus pimensis TaxID=309888 RepID=UPI000485D5FF|nr:hypothetical protein [Deinococcus pimensis]